MEDKRLDIVAIDNALVDITVDIEDSSLLDKYSLKVGDSVIGAKEQWPLIDDIRMCERVKYTAGGCSLNSLRAAGYILRQNGRKSNMALLGSVGSDANGQFLSETLETEDITPLFHQEPELPTGICPSLVLGNERTLCSFDGASTQFPTSHLAQHSKAISGARFVHTNAFFIPSNAEAFTQLCKLCVDRELPFLFNLASTYMLREEECKEALWQGVEVADFVFCNEDEALEVASQNGLKDAAASADFIANYGSKQRTAVVTQGKDNIIVVSPNGTFTVDVPAVDESEIVDSNGCGDSFIGGFMAGLVQGKDLTECVKLGIQMSQMILKRSGCSVD